MYNNKDEYIEATKDASVNTYGHQKISNRKLIILNLFLASTLGIMGYIGFDAFAEKTPFLKQTTVMGVSHTINDENYIAMLNRSEVDTLKNSEDGLRSAIDTIVSTSSGEEDSYVKSISKEISAIKEQKKEKEIITIVVKKGDTLASLAEEYYGDSMAYRKIIEANSKLTEASSIIYVGETINLPY